MLKIPWRMTNFLSTTRCSLIYYYNFLNHNFGKRYKSKKLIKIEFNIPFYGFTGGSIAIVTVANLLCDEFCVQFVTHPKNPLNIYLSKYIKFVNKPSPDAAAYIIESGVNLDLIKSMVNNNAKVVITNHGFYSTDSLSIKNYGYTDLQVSEALQLATCAHFISDEQVFSLEKLGIQLSHITVIANSVVAIQKNTFTRAVGIVGDTTLALKNVTTAVAAAEASDAKAIHVWGRYNSTFNSHRAQWHGFERNKVKIYNSFDVLVSLSLIETQPLIVLEALSAGIPCVLSDLPCYSSLKNTPGIIFVDASDKDAATTAINDLLNTTKETRDSLRELWRLNFSPNIIQNKWIIFLNDLIKNADR